MVRWARQDIEVQMNGHKRLMSERERNNLVGSRACEVVEFLRRKGFEAIVNFGSTDSMRTWDDKAKARRAVWRRPPAGVSRGGQFLAVHMHH